MPGSAGKGKGKEEDPVISHHAVAYLNLAPLLYPGATHIAGAYQLHPYSHSEASGKVSAARNRCMCSVYVLVSPIYIP